MSDIFASVAAGTPRPAGVAASEAAVRIVDPAPEFARLTAGESLRGTVVGRDDQGHLLVRTNLALVKLAAVRALPVGTEVILQIRSVGPQVVVNLLPIENAAAGGSAPSGQLQPSPAPAVPTPVLPANPSDLVQRGQIIRAVLHAAPPMPLLTGLPTAEPGAELLVRILSLGVQSPGSAGGAGPQASGAAAAGGAAAAPSTGSPPGATSGGAIGQASPSGLGAKAPAPAPAGGGTLPTVGASPGPTPLAPPGLPSNPQLGAQPGGQLAAQPGAVPGNAAAAGALASGAPGLRLAPQAPVANTGHSVATALQGISAEAATKAAGTLPGATTLAGPNAPGAPVGADTVNPAAAGLRVSGLVTAATNSGQPILHTPLGTVTLDTRATLPVGTSLALEVTLAPTGATPSGQALATAWPSLNVLEETLVHGLPAAQVDMVTRSLPQIGPRLASGVLFFLSALNQGNVLGWLAPTAAAGERSERGELYERLGREFAGLSRAIETTAGEWRFTNLPLWSEHGLRELRCFIRHQDHGDGKGNGGGEKATRFVLELELKDHGELQLDGLVRMQRFDLVLRSRRALPAMVRGDLMALFEETNDIAGYSGRLVFQASHDWSQLLSAQSATTPHDGLNV